MCGISGYCGKQYNPLILKLLSLFNERRGDDSVGIINDGERIIFSGWKGGENTGKSSICQQTFQYAEQPDTYTVLQHNRRKSSGVVDEKSAHPYVYEYTHEGEDHKFYFMHNGTLKRPYELATHYGKKWADYHTDSHLLGELVMEKGFEPFKLYNGGAACAFYWSHEPNKLYLWKGAEKIHVKDGSYMSAERPLYYSIDDTGLYFASEDGFLEGCGFEDIEEAPDNSILVINNGIIEEDILIKREPLVVKYESNNKNHTTKVSYTKISKDEYDPRQFIVDRVVFYKNQYWYNKYAVDGVMNINEEYDIVDDNSGKEYFFIDGFWIKDKAAYNKIRNIRKKQPDYKVKSKDLHHESLFYLNDYDEGVYYTNGHRISESIIKPKFCYFYYSFDNKGKLITTHHFSECIGEGLISKDQYLVERFNYSVSSPAKNTYYFCNTIEDCKALAKSWAWEVDLENGIADFPPVIQVHDKYLLSFEPPVDEALLEFNKLNFTDEQLYCKTRREANDYYKELMGQDYHKTWKDEIPF